MLHRLSNNPMLARTRLRPLRQQSMPPRRFQLLLSQLQSQRLPRSKWTQLLSLPKLRHLHLAILFQQQLQWLIPYPRPPNLILPKMRLSRNQKLKPQTRLQTSLSFLTTSHRSSMRSRTNNCSKRNSLSNPYRRRKRLLNQRSHLDLLVNIRKSSSKRKQRKIMKILLNYRHRLKIKQRKNSNRSQKRGSLRDLRNKLTGMSQINKRLRT